jgi:hypothetical protein
MNFTAMLKVHSPNRKRYSQRMALPREYAGQDCPVARALEIIGERWTLLIVRDAFYGVSRFSDFRDHLGIPRAVLTASWPGSPRPADGTSTRSPARGSGCGPRSGR